MDLLRQYWKLIIVFYYLVGCTHSNMLEVNQILQELQKKIDEAIKVFNNVVNCFGSMDKTNPNIDVLANPSKIGHNDGPQTPVQPIKTPYNAKITSDPILDTGRDENVKKNNDNIEDPRKIVDQNGDDHLKNQIKKFIDTNGHNSEELLNQLVKYISSSRNTSSNSSQPSVQLKSGNVNGLSGNTNLDSVLPTYLQSWG